jgi:hypothetical protein
MHGFQLGVCGCNQFQCTNANEFPLIPGAKKSNPWEPEFFNIKGKHIFGWRDRMTEVQVLLKEG